MASSETKKNVGNIQLIWGWLEIKFGYKKGYIK